MWLLQKVAYHHSVCLIHFIITLKDLRAALEYEIYRQLQMAPPLDEGPHFGIAYHYRNAPALSAADRGSGDGVGGGDAAGDELLQLLGLDPLTANSAAATELLLANFCSSMQQMGDEKDAFLRTEDAGDQVRRFI